MANTASDDSDMGAQAGVSVGWTVAALIVAVGLALALFFETARSMVAVWSSSATYGHGFLIVPIAGYLAYARRERLGRCPIGPSLLGVGAVAGAALVWLAGDVADINLLRHFGLVVVLQGIVVAVLGLRTAGVLAVPLGYLLLAVPFGDFMIEPLQWLTAQYTTELVRLSGVPVHLDGWFMTIPGGTFHVAEACAGVRYLLACLAFGLLVCDLFFRRAWKVVAYVVLTFAVPVVANVLRAYGIVMLAHLSDFEIAVGVDHLIYGYVFLSLVTVILIGIALAMRDPDARRRGFTDVQGEPEAKKSSVGGRRAVALVALLVLLGGVRGYAYTVAPPTDGASDVDLLAPTSEGSNWRALPDQPSDWRPHYPAADAQALWRFVQDDREVSVFLAHYRYERPGAELIAERNRLGDPDAAEIMARGVATTRPRTDWPKPAYIRLAGPGGTKLIWYWYSVDGKLVNTPYHAKLQRILAQFTGPVASSVIAIGTEDGPEAPGTLSRFLDDVDLEGALPGRDADQRRATTGGS